MTPDPATRLQTAEMISTGAELLSGRSVNLHAQTLGDRLRPLDVRLVRDTTVPDDFDGMVDALRGALDRVDLVFVTGGLGPTDDDVTRDAVAHVLARKVIMDEAVLRDVRERYAKYGRSLSPSGERQAQMVEGAVALSNRVGAAPGERIEAGDKLLFLLPGPSGEFRSVLEDHVLPWLAKKIKKSPESVRDQTFVICGLGESDIVNRFDNAGFPPPGVDVAYCASAGRVEVRVSVEGGPGAADDPGARLEGARAQVRELLGDHVVAEERLELQELIGRRLKEKGRTLATAESCTGGMLGDLITSVSGSSAYYKGGIIAYSNEAKVRELGVPEDVLVRNGAVSETVVRQMARAARERFGADYGIGVTGIAGPSGGTPEKPVGLVFIGCADVRRDVVRRHHFPGDRALIKEWSCVTAMDQLRRMMAE